MSEIRTDLTAFQDACREKGLRVTPQRLEIYSELAKAKDHPNAETLYQRLAERLPMLSLDTVYRTLSTLHEVGLVNRVDTAESQAHFEVVQPRHHHLICDRCKKIIDFHWPRIDAAELPSAVSELGRFERKNVVVYGICNECLMQSE